MGTLNPAPQFAIPTAGEQQAPSTLQGLSGLIEAGIDLATPSQPAAPTSAQLDSANYSEFARELGRAQDLRRAGRTDEALRIESNAAVAFTTSGGDLSSGRATSLVTQMTGRPEGFQVGFTESQTMQMQLMETPEFQRARVATFGTHPDASEEERTQLALTSMARSEANTAMIETAGFNWTGGGQDAFSYEVSNFRNTLMGGISVTEQRDGTLTNADVQQARVEYQAFRSELYAMRPAGISNTEWQPIADQIDSLDSELAYLEQLTSADNISAQMTLDFIRAIQSTDSEKWEQSVVAQMYQNDVSLLPALGVMGTDRLQEILRSAVSVPTSTPGAIRNPSAWPEAQMNEDGAPRDPLSVLQDAQNQLTIAGGVGNNLYNNPEVRDQWGTMVTQSLSNVRALSESGEWVTGDVYDEMFNDTFFNNLEEVRQVDPTLYEAIRSRTQETLTQAGTALNAKLNSIEGGSPLMFNPASGEFGVTRESVLTYIENTHGSSPIGGVFEFMKDLTPSELIEKAVDDVYNGDYQAFFNDKGARLNEGYDNETDILFREAGNFITDMSSVNADTEALVGSMRTISELQGRLVPVEQPSSTPNPAAAPASTPQGSTTQISSRTSPLSSLIDSTEGAGDYDTLFGFANRAGGQFADVKVSQMTIGELKEFSGARGEGSYGQFVRGTNPEGVLATPMGRYQFVGTTLAATAREMGLPDDTVFTPEVQDAMFSFKVDQRLSSASTPEGMRSQLRSEWAGLNHVSDADLDAAIAAHQSGEPLDISSLVMGSVGAESPSDVRIPPEVREDLDLRTGGTQGTVTAPTEGATGSTQEAEVPTQGTTVTGGSTASSQAVSEANRMAANILDNLGQAYTVVNSDEELATMKQNGQVSTGDVVLVNGRIERIE